MSRYRPSSRWVSETSALEAHFTPRVVKKIIEKTITSRRGRKARVKVAKELKHFSLPWDMDDERTQAAETPSDFLARACKVGAQQYVWLWRTAELGKSRLEHRRQLTGLAKKCSEIRALLSNPTVALAALKAAARRRKIHLGRKNTWLEAPSAPVDKYAHLSAEFDIQATTASIELLELLADDAASVFARKHPKGGDESLEWLFRFLKSIFEQVFERKFAASNLESGHEVGGPAVRFCTAVLSELGITMTGNAIRDRINLADPQSPRHRRKKR